MQALKQDIPVKLFSSCFITKGATRSIIIDIQKNQFHYIPNSLYYILKQFNGKTIQDIKRHYNNEYDGILDEYFDFLNQGNFIFYTTQPDCFPEIDFSFKNPSDVSNAIIEVNDDILISIQETVEQLDELGCKAILIRALTGISLSSINKLTDCFRNTGIQFIELVLAYNPSFNYANLTELFYKENRLFKIIIHSAIENNSHIFENGEGRGIYFTKEQLSIETCGNISPSYFALNLRHISEAQSCNTCLNKKVSIDVNGNVKSCPAISRTYGNLKTTSLKNVLQAGQIKEFWDISKDKINICKDCEHRYVCSDCRAFIDNSEDVYSKPSKCSYNPYIGKWKGEEGYISEKEMSSEEIELVIKDND